MTRAEKDANFRRMYKAVYRIAENGTWNDLTTWRREFNQLVAQNALLKGDAKLLDKGDTFAEHKVLGRRKAG